MPPDFARCVPGFGTLPPPPARVPPRVIFAARPPLRDFRRLPLVCPRPVCPPRARRCLCGFPTTVWGGGERVCAGGCQHQHQSSGNTCHSLCHCQMTGVKRPAGPRCGAAAGGGRHCVTCRAGDTAPAAGKGAGLGARGPGCFPAPVCCTESGGRQSRPVRGGSSRLCKPEASTPDSNVPTQPWGSCWKGGFVRQQPGVAENLRSSQAARGTPVLLVPGALGGAHCRLGRPLLNEVWSFLPVPRGPQRPHCLCLSAQGGDPRRLTSKCRERDGTCGEGSRCVLSSGARKPRGWPGPPQTSNPPGELGS